MVGEGERADIITHPCCKHCTNDNPGHRHFMPCSCIDGGGKLSVTVVDAIYEDGLMSVGEDGEKADKRAILVVITDGTVDSFKEFRGEDCADEAREAGDSLVLAPFEDNVQVFLNEGHGWDHHYIRDWVKEAENEIPRAVKREDERETAFNLFVGAVEGGSNYWYHLPDLAMVNRDGSSTLTEAVFKSVWDGGKTLPVHDMEDQDQHLGDLTRESMERAFDLMKMRFPRHYADLLDENEDATTSDIWFQLATMQEVVYG